MLRRKWGLNNILPDHNFADPAKGKNRKDHRHHAIDAAVIGATSRSLLQKDRHRCGPKRGGRRGGRVALDRPAVADVPRRSESGDRRCDRQPQARSRHAAEAGRARQDGRATAQ
jgi:hypothetical protein